MKSTQGKAGPAVKKASPAFAEPLHVGRPNIGDPDRIREALTAILERRWLTNNGPVVQAFERRVAEHLGVRHCVAMCNGTIALEIAIRALGLEGEVIVPSWTFIATAHALHWQGITPVFADIDPETHNLDPEAVRRMITPRTSGIIGVHLWGRPAPVDELQALAEEYGLKLMFDAAHAFGCSYGGRRVGNFGSCEVLSFHATKVLNSMEGGAVVTNDDRLAESMRLMRNFGFKGYDNVVYPGTNGKLPELNAAVGIVNLDSVPDFIETNRKAYDAYKKGISEIPGLKLIEYERDNNPNYHYVVVEVAPGLPVGRDELVERLHAENVLARKYFWPGCHAMKPYVDLRPDAAKHLRATVGVAERVIVLPTGLSIDETSAETVLMVLRSLL